MGNVDSKNTDPLVMITQILVESEAVLEALALLEVFYNSVAESSLPLANSLPRQILKLIRVRDVQKLQKIPDIYT